MRPIILLAITLFALVGCTPSKNRRIVYDANGKKDSVIVFVSTDSIQIPDMSGPGETILFLAKFKNYDNGKLISSGTITNNQAWGTIKYHKKSTVTTPTENGTTTVFKMLGPDIYYTTRYSANGTKMFDADNRKRIMKIYDSNGKLDTLKYAIVADTIMIPSLDDPDMMAMEVVGKSKFKKYQKGKVIASGELQYRCHYGPSKW